MADRLCSEDAVVRCVREELREAMAGSGDVFYDRFVDGLGIEAKEDELDVVEETEEDEVAPEVVEEEVKEEETPER